MKNKFPTIRHSLAIPSVGRVKIRLTKHGIAISIPNRKQEVAASSQKMSIIGRIEVFCIWLTGWTIGGIFTIKYFLTELFNGQIDWFLGFWLCGWAVGEITAGRQLAKA